MFSFEIIFFQKFIQNVIPRMLQVVQELIPVDEVIKLFFARTVFNLFFFNFVHFSFYQKKSSFICKLNLCRTKHVSYWRFSTKCWNVKSPSLFPTLKPHWNSAFRFVISKNSPWLPVYEIYCHLRESYMYLYKYMNVSELIQAFVLHIGC